MVDLLSIGSGAVNAYRQALSTTSNNIANVNTPGYSRRELQIGESFPVEEGVFSFGSGAQAEAVGRAYDEFIERALRDATSELEVNEPVIEYTNRIVDIMGTESVSLANAMDDFFNAAEQLSTDPKSGPLRTEFLNSGEVVAVRFNDIALQVDNIAKESEVSFRRSVDELNALSVQLMKVNQQLQRKTSILEQPPSILDQRDAILRDMSALVKLGVTELPSGQVVVNFGGPGRGFEIVTPTESRDIGLFSSDKTAGTDLRLILDPYGAKRPLPSAPSGAIGGALEFRAEVLRPVRIGLDYLARTLADEANKIHRQGLDANGAFGGDLFQTTTTFEASLNTVNGALSVSTTVTDPLKAPTEALELIYRETTNSWDILNLLTRERLAEVSGGEKQSALGMSFSLVGEPKNGDVVILHPKDRPASTFALMVKDIDRIATAAAMRQIPGASNTSGAEAALEIIAEKDRPTGFQYGYSLSNKGETESRYDLTVKADGLRPAVQVAKGTVGSEILFDIAKDGDQHIQVLTKEGVHVAGTATLTTSEGNALISLDTGFGSGSYTTTYLNQTGTSAYLDTTVQFGVSGKAETVSVPVVNPDTGLRTTQSITEPALITSKKISASGTGTLVAANALNFTTKYYDPSNGSADADGNVSQTIALGALTEGGTLSAAKMATYFNTEFKKLSSVNVHATASNQIQTQNFDASVSGLLINGQAITYTASANIGGMIQAINEKSALTHVRADWLAESGITLSNASGHEGENIVLGLSGGGTGITALGLVTGTYEGNYQIAAVGEEVLSNTFTSATQSLNSGSAFNITVTPEGGSASTVTVAAGSDTPQGIVSAINGISGISAVLLADGSNYRISLRDTTAAGRDFSVASTVVNYKPVDAQGIPLERATNDPASSSATALADTDFGFNDKNNRNIGLNKPIEISLTLSGSGTPANLGRMALNTGVLIDGKVPDDLAIFVTGSGTVKTALRADAATAAVSTYPASPFKVNFTSDTVYTITDTATSTVVATRLYTAGSDIDYQGIKVQFDNIPKSGDSYFVENNTDGLGSNKNVRRLIELGKAPVISGQTFSAAYRDLVSGAGSRSQLAELGREAMLVVRDQAQASRESAVGVNLDEEAANLIRFQQAYQAAAQVIQMSQRLFETLIQAS
ncbi:MAG: flagellar hook-associated protein FlgK [Luminiphilus sp.]|nr:flagellar hook-associated protein FlgK [Luminiphilus sp.]